MANIFNPFHHPSKMGGYDDTIDWYTLKYEKPSLWEYYQKDIQNTAAHKRYIQIAWHREQPFDEIINRLKELTSFIATLLVL